MQLLCMAAQDLKQRWQLHAVEPLPNTSERGPDKEDPIKFRCTAQHLQPCPSIPNRCVPGERDHLLQGIQCIQLDR